MKIFLKVEKVRSEVSLLKNEKVYLSLWIKLKDCYNMNNSSFQINTNFLENLKIFLYMM